MTDRVRVCEACGTPACVDGDLICDQSTMADTHWCTCAWEEFAVTLQPVAIDPHCEVHGEYWGELP